MAALAAMALIMVTSLLSLSPAAQYTTYPACPSSTQVQSNIDASWGPDFNIALIAVLISFLIATIIFMVGAAAKSDRIRNFGLGEIYEAITTAIIVGFFLFIAGLVINTVPSVLIGSTSSLSTTNSLVLFQGGKPTAALTDPYVFAIGGICNTIGNLEYIFDQNMFDISVSAPWLLNVNGCCTGYAQLAMALTVDYTIELPILGEFESYLQSFVAGSVAAIKLSDYVQYMLPIITLAPLITDLMAVLWSEYYLLVFFSFMSPILVATGVVFRAFFPTRAFGGMLIAIGMGFYVVMPTLFAFVFSQCTPNTSGCIDLNGLPGPLYTSVFAPMQPLWLFVLFYPVLVISVTYAFITQVANFIGASTQMGGRLRAGFI